MSSLMTSRGVVERLLAGIGAGVTPQLADLYADDALVELPFAPPAGLLLRGRAQVRDHFTRASAAPFQLRPENIRIHETDDPAVVVAEYDYLGELTSSGKVIRVANVQIVTVSDGLIAHSRDFHDHVALAAAIAS